jgi:hypothetical protein
VVGAYIAASVVAIVQYLRLRDWRVLALAALFAFQVQALSREWYDVWRNVYQSAACGAGLLLLFVLTPRNPAPVKPLSAPVPPAVPSQEVTPQPARHPRPPTT